MYYQIPIERDIKIHLKSTQTQNKCLNYLQNCNILYIWGIPILIFLAMNFEAPSSGVNH